MGGKHVIDLIKTGELVGEVWKLGGIRMVDVSN